MKAMCDKSACRARELLLPPSLKPSKSKVIQRTGHLTPAQWPEE